jgi:hypothetical protein
MNDPLTPCAARFFDKTRQDLGRATRVTTRQRSGSTLTVLDVVGAEPALARILTLLDRGGLRIHCEDDARTCYVFAWASGYGNGSDVRIQGVLEPRTGRELVGWKAKTVATPTPKPPVEDNKIPSWRTPRTNPWR